VPPDFRFQLSAFNFLLSEIPSSRRLLLQLNHLPIFCWRTRKPCLRIRRPDQLPVMFQNHLRADPRFQSHLRHVLNIRSTSSTNREERDQRLAQMRQHLLQLCRRKHLDIPPCSIRAGQREHIRIHISEPFGDELSLISGLLERGKSGALPDPILPIRKRASIATMRRRAIDFTVTDSCLTETGNSIPLHALCVHRGKAVRKTKKKFKKANKSWCPRQDLNLYDFTH
jgi:hypothetical protein